MLNETTPAHNTYLHKIKRIKYKSSVIILFFKYKQCCENVD